MYKGIASELEKSFTHITQVISDFRPEIQTLGELYSNRGTAPMEFRHLVGEINRGVTVFNEGIDNVCLFMRQLGDADLERLAKFLDQTKFILIPEVSEMEAFFGNDGLEKFKAQMSLKHIGEVISGITQIAFDFEDQDFMKDFQKTALAG